MRLSFWHLINERRVQWEEWANSSKLMGNPPCSTKMRTPWKQRCSLITFALRLIAESHLEIHICVFTHWPNGWGTCLSQYEIALCCTVKA